MNSQARRDYSKVECRRRHQHVIHAAMSFVVIGAKFAVDAPSH
jgi:hypothetical protein